MKDFFDIWFLCRDFEFQGQTLVDAIRATFERRQTPIPGEAPVALTDAFTLDDGKQTQWSAFLERSRVVERAVTLSDVVTVIAPFLTPVVEAAAGGCDPIELDPGWAVEGGVTCPLFFSDGLVYGC